jgi:pimeloyl-ACP methyl ester carboxylesterase
MTKPPIRRAFVALSVLGASLITATTAAARPSTPEPDPDGPTIEWQDCGDGFECGVLAAPVDYDEPDAESVGIGLIRLPAKNPDERIGSLLVNPGGPGGSGIDAVRDAGKTSASTLNERFDLVGFDPRGVGESGNIVCLTPEQSAAFAALPAPANDTEAFFRNIFLSAAEQQLCAANNPVLLDHVSTANVARDMDLIREAVGDEQLNYLGFSYGTYLGATYAALFPGEARALVLDGAVDPEEFANDPYEQWLGFAVGQETALDRFLANCESDSACLFGGPDAAGRYDALVAALNEAPLTVTVNGQELPVTGADLSGLTLQALYQRQLWPFLGQLLGEVQAGDTTTLTAVLSQLLAEPEQPTNAQQAILGADEAWPRSLFAALKSDAEVAETAPRLGQFAPAAIDFAFWPAVDDDAYNGPFSNPDDGATVLVVGTTFDNATPYDDAVKLTEQLGNARLLTSDGDGHTAFSRSGPCIDDAVTAYLFDLTLPAEGTVCVQDPTYQGVVPPTVAATDPEFVPAADRGMVPADVMDVLRAAER